LSLADSIRDRINGRKKDVRDAILGAIIDAVIVFLLMLPSASLPGIPDIYISIRVSLMVFFYSLARNLKLQTHFKELITFQCNQPTINLNNISSGCNNHKEGQKPQ